MRLYQGYLVYPGRRSSAGEPSNRLTPGAGRFWPPLFYIFVIAIKLKLVFASLLFMGYVWRGGGGDQPNKLCMSMGCVFYVLALLGAL
jgi:hypothetical protein